MKGKKEKRGQVTVEYLMILIVALTSITISLTALNAVLNAFEKAKHMTEVKGDVDKITETVKEVCLLGKGNQRSIYIKTKLGISCKKVKDAWEITFNYSGTDTTSRWVPCKCKGNNIKPGNVVIGWDEILDQVAIR